MSPYRQPSPHVCRFEIVRWPPPHHDVPLRQCRSCGAYQPMRWWERALDFVLGSVFP